MGGSVRPIRRHHLQKRIARSLLEEIRRLYPSFPLANVDIVEEAVFEDDVVVYILNGKPSFFRYEGRLVPLLTLLLDLGYEWLPQVYVDRGASKAMVRGADLMIPGIRGVKGVFQSGSVVVIVDEESKAPVAVGEALMDSKSLELALSTSGKGRALKNIHHVGDKLWGIANLIR